jgi:hypothetical protein
MNEVVVLVVVVVAVVVLWLQANPVENNKTPPR